VLTKAIIQSIDYTKNMCRVRIPLFENAARNVNIIEADAQINIVPGIYNSYKTGDIVFIGFEENKMELPVILGKLFVSAATEASSYRGNVSGNSLAITDTAQLPYSTIFNYDKISQNSNLYKDLNTPKKLADSILDLRRTQSQTQKYQTIIETAPSEGVKYDLYLKTSYDFTYSSGSSDEPLNRLCTVLKNSQAESTVIPLEFALETVVTAEEVENNAGEKETIYVTNYTIHQALLRVQEFNSYTLKLDVVIDGVTYEISKDKISKIQSTAIYY
jgi:hypothetical protein